MHKASPKIYVFFYLVLMIKDTLKYLNPRNVDVIINLTLSENMKYFLKLKPNMSILRGIIHFYRFHFDSCSLGAFKYCRTRTYFFVFVRDMRESTCSSIASRILLVKNSNFSSSSIGKEELGRFSVYAAVLNSRKKLEQGPTT